MKNTGKLFAVAILAIFSLTGCEKDEKINKYTDLQKQEFNKVLEARKAEEEKKLIENRTHQLYNEILVFGSGVYYIKNELFGNTLAKFIKEQPDLRVVSVCGDSEGSSYSRYSQGATARHKGYWVVTEPK